MNFSIHFRYLKNNMHSIAALLPLLPDADIVQGPGEGIMIYSFASVQAPEIFYEVKNSVSNSIFIAGGPHASARPEKTLRFFDYVVIGEGEETLPELMRILKNGEDVSSVMGIAFKSQNGIVFTEKRKHVDLDRYPPFGRNGVRSAIEITRGCPFSCAYCQTPRLFGHSMRHRSINEIAIYARTLRDVRFISPNAFAYGSDGINPRIDKIEALLRNLPRKNIFFGTFPSEVRPEFIDDRILELVSDYCSNTTISFGAQSGSQKMLDIIHRGHTVDDIIAGAEKCLQHGFTPLVDFIFGLPGETEGDQLETLRLIQWLTGKGGKIHSHYFMKLPGTEFENSAPSRVSVQVEKTMGKLALFGKTTGVWSKA